jgi:hypothetical protein
MSRFSIFSLKEVFVALNPLSPQEFEAGYGTFARNLIQCAADAESFAEFAESILTETNRTNGTLIQGYMADGTPIPWTTQQLADAQSVTQTIRGFSNWMRAATGTPPKSPLQRVMALSRTTIR